MKIFVTIGTHFPEMIRCTRYLGKQLAETVPVQLYLPEGTDIADPKDAFLEVGRYDPETVQWVFDPDTESAAFIIVDPATPLLEQIEILAEDLRKCLIEPAKVITCVDMANTEKHSALERWYDAAIYYTDVVLLGNRENATKPFVRKFEKGYEQRCYPCLFSLLKGDGIPADSNLILGPDARRLSQIFDLATDLPDQPGMIIESSCDLDVEEPEMDPYRNENLTEEQAPAPLPDISAWIVTTADS